ncbi:MAG TPA: hypothetical protein VK633_09195, partial [Verrucomicrobiae bacterium]|nr:hypothetical protein [Verrucomicrobiae bacterium]
YVIAESGGLLSTGTVSIVIEADLEQSQNIAGMDDLGNGTSRIRFAGIPSRAYSIEYTESLTPPNWQSLGNTSANAAGAFEFNDSPPDGAPVRFYRSSYP